MLDAILLPQIKWFRTRENVHVDDLVLEVDRNHKRSQWKLARVIATYPGNDGLFRKASESRLRVVNTTGQFINCVS